MKLLEITIYDKLKLEKQIEIVCKMQLNVIHRFKVHLISKRRK